MIIDFDAAVDFGTEVQAAWNYGHATAMDLTYRGGPPAQATRAAPATTTATSSSSGTATERWNAAIEAKIKPGVTRQQATVAVIKEQPKLQAEYIEEFRKQAALR